MTATLKPAIVSLYSEKIQHRVYNLLFVNSFLPEHAKNDAYNQRGFSNVTFKTDN